MRMRELIDYLKKRPQENQLQFAQALIKTGQKFVLTEVLGLTEAEITYIQNKGNLFLKNIKIIYTLITDLRVYETGLLVGAICCHYTIYTDGTDSLLLHTTLDVGAFSKVLIYIGSILSTYAIILR